jgi:hypothetical protein
MWKAGGGGSPWWKVHVTDCFLKCKHVLLAACHALHSPSGGRLYAGWMCDIVWQACSVDKKTFHCYAQKASASLITQLSIQQS